MAEQYTTDSGAQLIQFILDSMRQFVWMPQCARTLCVICTAFTSLEFTSTRQRWTVVDLHLVHTIFPDWLGKMKDSCVAVFDAYLWFPTLVDTCDSSSLSCIYSPFCLKVSKNTLLGSQQWQNISALLWIWCLFFCPAQRKWVCRLGFLIMRKPRFTFCTSSFECAACALSLALCGLFQ